MRKAIIALNNKEKIIVGIADSFWSKARGLSFYNSEISNGMIFMFSNPRLPFFWNFGMKFPVDVFWMKNNEIADICDMPAAKHGIKIICPKIKIDCVLELNSRVTRDFNPKKGDKIEIINIK